MNRLLTTTPPGAAVTCQLPAFPNVDDNNLQSFNPGFTSIAVFGDSFSDMNNIFDASDGKKPGIHSFDGRYSDGRVWVEYLASYFDLHSEIENYAWGGATVNNSYIPSYSSYLEGPVPGVIDQVSTYISEIGDDSIANTLHVLWAGYNDYWWYAYNNITDSDDEIVSLSPVYQNVTRSIKNIMESLYSAGARKFMVGNVPNMTQMPEALSRSKKIHQSYDILANGHNKKLSTILTNFGATNPDTNIYSFDAFNALQCIDVQKKFLGFLNVQDACYPSPDAPCSNIFSFKFWDNYHFTTHSHNVIAGTAIQSIFEGIATTPSTSSTSSSAPNTHASTIPLKLSLMLLSAIMYITSL